MRNIVRVRGFSGKSDYDLFSVVRVNNDLLRSLGGRYAWVEIRAGTEVIFRRAMGAVPGVGLPADAIELGYDSRRDLGILDERGEDNFYACKLTIAPASLVGRFRGHWRNPNVEYRAPFQLGLIGFVLGIVGLLLGIFSLLK